jgi:hypothetical protein
VSGGPSGRVGLVLGVLSLLVHDVDAVPSAVGRGMPSPRAITMTTQRRWRASPTNPRSKRRTTRPLSRRPGPFLTQHPRRSFVQTRLRGDLTDIARTSGLLPCRRTECGTSEEALAKGYHPAGITTEAATGYPPTGVAAAIALLRQEDDIEATEEDGTLVVKCRCGWFGAGRAVLDAERGSCRRSSSLRMAPSLFRGLW